MKKISYFLVGIVILCSFELFSKPSDDFIRPIRFPFQDSTKINYCQSQPLFINNEILVFFTASNSLADTIFLTRSSDNGMIWTSPVYVSSYLRRSQEMIFLSGTISKTGRLLLVFTIGETPTNNKTKFIHSDDNGSTWSLPQNVIGSAYISNPKMTETEDGKLWIVGRINNFFYSTNDGNSWIAKNIGFSEGILTSFDLISLDSINYLMVYDKYDSNTDSYKIFSRKSTDSGNSWVAQAIITEENLSEQKPRLLKDSNATIWLITQSKDSTSFTTDYDIYQQNISYRKSTDNGNSWHSANKFTTYLGFDGAHNLCKYNDKPLITFLSNRWFGINQIWLAQLEVSQDNDSPPVLYKYENSDINLNSPISVRALVGSSIGIQKTTLLLERNNTSQVPFPMFDDGNHGDGLAGDNIWATNIGPFYYYDVVKTFFTVTDNNSFEVKFPGSSLVFPSLPSEFRWLTMGSLYNWYSSRGSEVEEGYVRQQQYGLRWPGIYRNQDMQAAKGFWIGAKNFTDENGRFFPYKVVHVGPRVSGEYEFFPKEFKLISKLDPPDIFVDGALSNYTDQIDQINPNLPCDRMIYNRINTQLGITVERKIYQFSQEYHDNYLINEYTFTNTGNVDYDDIIELPNNIINGIYFYYIFRWAINSNTRFVIGNATGWGINTMLDTRGDGSTNDPPDETFRAQYAWHGKYPPFTAYDNIGGPIWSSGVNVEINDTIGRLGAYQFPGVVTLQADTSAIDKTDDSNQPSTTSWESSDDALTSNNDAFNDQKMTGEYTWMSKGHKSPRHAYAVDPTGNFSEQTGDPALGTPGGFSAANGYGPYTLGPGESITIAWAEAANGINRQLAIDVGRQYKWGQISAKQKNEIVLTGKDSLFQTFRKAILNYNNGKGFMIPQPPYPPDKFEVNSGEDRVYMSWNHNGMGPSVRAYEIYRASGSYDSVYSLIHISFPTDKNFTDSNIHRGIPYYYYIQSVGDPLANNGQALTPLGALKSSRYYTQTYNPVFSTLTSIEDENQLIKDYMLFQNFPNPFNPNTKVSWQSPMAGWQSLKIFDVLGNEVATLVNEYKPAGIYNIEFNANHLASGIYFYRLQAGKFVETMKMVLMK